MGFAKKTLYFRWLSGEKCGKTRRHPGYGKKRKDKIGKITKRKIKRKFWELQKVIKPLLKLIFADKVSCRLGRATAADSSIRQHHVRLPIAAGRVKDPAPSRCLMRKNRLTKKRQYGIVPSYAWAALLLGSGAILMNLYLLEW